ncbi:trypsin-like peptidase domain-containing protein [Plantactinospora sp. B24E8]|uniref:nSTAND1 domain-containing NTPase n=1 Tax=Plantactinospora sp. B24E8 TaxID=3153567 RepID=UPI00325C85B8
MMPDERVPGFLGRVLDVAGRPEGTCFQVAPGVFVTAWHVLRNIGVGTADTGDIGGVVQVDPLAGGHGFAARIVNVDRVHDLAVLRAEGRLPAVAPGVAATDAVELRAEVVVTGSVDLPDFQEYRFLDAPGHWAGGTTRDGVRLGRLTASAVMRGMSGAPVRGADGTVVGVVSARYNTNDNWGRDTVWVARTEDLAPLLRDVGVEPRPSEKAEYVEPPVPGICPYPGLSAFTAGQAEWFFGREELTAKLVDRLVVARDRGLPLLVVGVSGSGKSSLLQAGLVPALSRGDLPIPGSADWPRIRLTPGSRPLTELVSHMAVLAGSSVGALVDEVRDAPIRFAALARQAALADAGRKGLDRAGPVVLIVDQFEEIFTLCGDATERAAFIAALRAAADSVAGDETTPSALVLASLRTDFFSACAEEPGLAEILQDNQFLVGPMTIAELRSVVEGPAVVVGLDIERGLVDRVLEDVVDAAGHQPGTLPLLAYALEATWNKRRGNTMALASYQESGGVRGAISEAAERLFTSLSEPEQKIARRMLLTMVAVGNGVDDTRRRVPKSELTGGGDDSVTVLNRLVATRLVALDKDTVEIAHEALLRAWPRLTTWLSEDRAGLIVHRRLTDATNDWLSLDRDGGSLIRGARLADTRAWLAERDDRLTGLSNVEREFVAASEGAEESARETVRRNNRRLRRGVVALAFLLVAALVAGGLALWQQRVADEQRYRAEQQRAVALSRLHSSEALATRDSDPRRSLLLAIAAWQAAPTEESRGAILSAQGIPYRGVLGPVAARLFDTALSPDGTLAALAASDGSVTLWDTESRRQVAELTGADGNLPIVEFSPDGNILGTAHASERAEHRLRLWDVRTRELIRSLPGDAVNMAFSRDGTSMATASRSEPSIVLWDVASGRRVRTYDKGSGTAFGVALSPDGSLLAAGGGDNSVRVWQTATGRRVAVLNGHEKYVTSTSFSPSGRLLASGSADGTVRLWDVRAGRAASVPILRPPGGNEFVKEAVFSPDGRHVIAGMNRSRSVQWWRVVDGAAVRSFVGHTEGVVSVGFSRDGHTVLSGSLDRSAILWRAQTRVIDQSHAPTAVAFSPDRRLLAFTRGSVVTLWDLAKQSVVRELNTGVVTSLSFKPDSAALATAGADGTVRLWNLATGQAGRPGATGDGTVPYAVQYSPDGRVLAAFGGPSLDAINSGDVTILRLRLVLWDLASPNSPPVLITYEPDDVSHDPYPGGNIDFSPDGSLLAVPLSNGTIELRAPRTGDLVDTLNGRHGFASAVAFNQDGTLLASGGNDRKLRLWDVASRKEVGGALSGHGGAIRGVDFLPDGDTLASVSDYDVSLRLWEVSTQRFLAAVRTSTSSNALAVQPDTGLIAVAGVYSQINIVDPDPDRVVSDVCAALHGTQTVAEAWKAIGNDPDQAPRC